MGTDFYNDFDQTYDSYLTSLGFVLNNDSKKKYFVKDSGQTPDGKVMDVDALMKDIVDTTYNTDQGDVNKGQVYNIGNMNWDKAGKDTALSSDYLKGQGDLPALTYGNYTELVDSTGKTSTDTIGTKTTNPIWNSDGAVSSAMGTWGVPEEQLVKLPDKAQNLGTDKDAKLASKEQSMTLPEWMSMAGKAKNAQTAEEKTLLKANANIKSPIGSNDVLQRAIYSHLSGLELGAGPNMKSSVLFMSGFVSPNAQIDKGIGYEYDKEVQSVLTGGDASDIIGNFKALNHFSGNNATANQLVTAANTWETAFGFNPEYTLGSNGVDAGLHHSDSGNSAMVNTLAGLDITAGGKIANVDKGTKALAKTFDNKFATEGKTSVEILKWNLAVSQELDAIMFVEPALLFFAMAKNLGLSVTPQNFLTELFGTDNANWDKTKPWGGLYYGKDNPNKKFFNGFSDAMSMNVGEVLDHAGGYFGASSFISVNGQRKINDAYVPIDSKGLDLKNFFLDPAIVSKIGTWDNSQVKTDSDTGTKKFKWSTISLSKDMFDLGQGSNYNGFSSYSAQINPVVVTALSAPAKDASSKVYVDQENMAFLKNMFKFRSLSTNDFISKLHYDGEKTLTKNAGTTDSAVQNNIFYTDPLAAVNYNGYEGGKALAWEAPVSHEVVKTSANAFDNLGSTTSLFNDFI